MTRFLKIMNWKRKVMKHREGSCHQAAAEAFSGVVTRKVRTN